ncbi:MAG TPA: DUF1287 domain-containing protein [Verrucomicrobiales bacterium]|nr:DUF1287 domain-containing protein [Verrucomicrobiales bacterium]
MRLFDTLAKVGGGQPATRFKSHDPLHSNPSPCCEAAFPVAGAIPRTFDPNMNVHSGMVMSLISGVLLVSAAERPNPAGIVDAARAQIGKTVRYDPGYRALDYPNGDVPIEMGVCTDVVVRALRTGFGMDLQKLVHEDMKRNFSRYPQKWGLKRADKNIDHRRVPNLQAYFKRSGWELEISKDPQDYRPGDLVTCIVPLNLAHIMIVSTRTNAEGRPFVIHNIGAGTQEEDRLFDFKITGHYRVGRIEPDDPANASLPIRSETKRTSSADGSRR